MLTRELNKVTGYKLNMKKKNKQTVFLLIRNMLLENVM